MRDVIADDLPLGDQQIELLQKLYQLLLLDRVDAPTAATGGDTADGLWGYSHEQFCVWRGIQPRKRAIATTYFALRAIQHLHRTAGQDLPERFVATIRDKIDVFEAAGLSFRHQAFVTWLRRDLGMDDGELPQRGWDSRIASTDESWQVGAIAAAVKWSTEGRSSSQDTAEPSLCSRLTEALLMDIRQPGIVATKLAVHSWLGARDLVNGLCPIPDLDPEFFEQAKNAGDVAMCCGMLAASPGREDIWKRLSYIDRTYEGYKQYFSSYSAHLFLRLPLTAALARKVISAGAHLLEGRREPTRLLVARELSLALGNDAARAALRRGQLKVPPTVLVVGNRREPMGEHAARETEESWGYCSDIRPQFVSDDGFAGSPRFRRALARLLSDETVNAAAIVSVQPSRDARALRDFLNDRSIPSLLFLVVASRDDLLDRQPLRDASQTPVRVVRLPNNRQQALAISETIGGASRVVFVLENINDGYVQDLAHALYDICPATDQRFEYVTVVGTQFMTVAPLTVDAPHAPKWCQTTQSTLSTTHLTGHTLVYIGYPRGLTRLMTLWDRNCPAKIIASDGCSGAAFRREVITVSVDAKLRKQVKDLLTAINAVETAHVASTQHTGNRGLSPSGLGRRIMESLESDSQTGGNYRFRKNENTKTVYRPTKCAVLTPISWIDNLARPYLDWAFIARTPEVPNNAHDWTRDLRRAYDNVASLLEDNPTDDAPSAERVVLFHNTTSALQRVLISLSRDAGDGSPGSVLTTDVEYAGTYFSLRDNWRERVYIVQVADLLLKPGRFDEEALRKRFRKAFAVVKPRVVLMSHVERATGFVMPVAKLVEDLELMAPRRDDFFVLIDGAQGVGNVKMHNISTAVDFYVGCTHKWLGGEPTLGFLYSRKPQFDMRDPAQSYYLGATTGGAGNLNALASFNDVYDVWRQVPRSDYADQFVEACRRDALGVEVVGRDWGGDYRSAIVAFRSAGLTVAAIEETLRNNGYEVTLIGEHAFYEFGPNLPKEFLVLHSLDDYDETIEPVPLSDGFVNPHPPGGYLRLCLHPRNEITNVTFQELLKHFRR